MKYCCTFIVAITLITHHYLLKEMSDSSPKIIHDSSAVVIWVSSFPYLSVDGSWSCWSPWSKCSVTCGGGHYMRTRTCNNPPPAYGGDICLGLHTEEALCNIQPCPGTHTHFITCMNSTYVNSHTHAHSHLDSNRKLHGFFWDRKPLSCTCFPFVMSRV